MPDDQQVSRWRPEVLRHRDLRYFLGGFVFSHMGNHGTMAVVLFHMYMLTGSTLQVGLVGLIRGVASIVFAPNAGVLADRMDRKRLLQVSQVSAFVILTALGLATVLGMDAPWQILLAILVLSIVQTIELPVRFAIISRLVPERELVKAVSLVNPSGQISKLLGPALGGLIIAWTGPGVAYILGGVLYLVMVVLLARISAATPRPTGNRTSSWSSIRLGVSFVRDRPIIVQLASLDLAGTVFAAYRVVLPTIAVDMLQVGAAGYGLLSAVPPAGAMIAAVIVYRVTSHDAPLGLIAIACSSMVGVGAIVLGQSRAVWTAVLAVAMLGAFDAAATIIRHSAVLLETPDELRGRVQALYSMAARGGPAIGEMVVGAAASVLGVAFALSLGGLVTLAISGAVGLGCRTLREFRRSDGIPTA